MEQILKTTVNFSEDICEIGTRDPRNMLQATRVTAVSLLSIGRAVAQTVSHRLPTAAARVRDLVRSCGICGGQSGTGAGFLRVLWFPLPIILSIAPQSSSSSSSGAGTIGQ
jgi:hypothetical protein